MESQCSPKEARNPGAIVTVGPPKVTGSDLSSDLALIPGQEA